MTKHYNLLQHKMGTMHRHTVPVFNFNVTSEDDRRRQLSTAEERHLLDLNINKEHQHKKPNMELHFSGHVLILVKPTSS